MKTHFGKNVHSGTATASAFESPRPASGFPAGIDHGENFIGTSVKVPNKDGAHAHTLGNISIGHPDFSLLFELEQIRDHFYYANGG